MSKGIVALVLSLSFMMANVYGQSPGGGMTPPQFNANEAAGLFYYDMDKVIKKLKITKEADKQAVAVALSDYNQKIGAISAKNSMTFKKLENTFNKQVKIAMQNRDRSQMDGVKAQIQSTIPPIREEVNEHQTELNKEMAIVLTEKQNQKWLKYQKQKQKPN